MRFKYMQLQASAGRPPGRQIWAMTCFRAEGGGSWPWLGVEFGSDQWSGRAFLSGSHPGLQKVSDWLRATQLIQSCPGQDPPTFFQIKVP